MIDHAQESNLEDRIDAAWYLNSSSPNYFCSMYEIEAWL
jgi:hypothetical protein